MAAADTTTTATEAADKVDGEGATGVAEAEAEATDTAAEAPAIPTAYGVPVTEALGQTVLHPSPTEWPELAAQLKADGFVQCVDLCGVDYLTAPQRPGLPASITPERFEVVASFISHGTSGEAGTGSPAPATPATPAAGTPPRRLRVRLQISEAEPTLESVCSIYPGVETMEREIYDMFGISFANHPDLTRILMPEEWDGHPLRRDYAVGQVPVQFKGAAS